jgi:transcription initiation factor TFIID subunit 5|tara:strand:+ start:2548 stop:4779 length:2232 start_codon:yes stop_codon:yes gene_type:complete
MTSKAGGGEEKRQPLDTVVLKYLQKRGFKNAERALVVDAKLSKDATSSMSLVALGADAALSDLLVLHSLEDVEDDGKFDADSVLDGYARIREWIFGALDLYKSELMRVLFPMFVHSFLTLVKKNKVEESRDFFERFHEDHVRAHCDDIRGLSGIALPEHVDTDPYAVKFIKHKFSIEMCFQSFDLLVRFLRASDGNGAKCLAILNENVGVKITQKDSPSMFVEEEEEKNMDEIFSGVVTGETTASIAAYNSGPGRFGLLEQSLEIKAERAFREIEAKHEDAVKREDARVAAYKPKKVYKKRKKKDSDSENDDDEEEEDKEGEKISGEETIEVDGYKVLKRREIDVPNVPQTISRLRNPRLVDSEIPIPEYDYDDGLRVLEDFSNRVKVTSENLPSCCFFTFTHAEGKLICASMSPNVEKVAGGFSDSVVRTWDLTSGEKDEDDEEKEEGGKEKDGGGTTATENGDKEKTKKVYKRGDKVGKSMKVKEFIGHCAPVHDVQYSPDGIYLLSVSRDCTARMWSCELEIPLCAYKGHQTPIWCAKWASCGHYFATGSHDRTCRIWTTELSSPIRAFCGHIGDVDCVAWHPNSNYVATGSSDRTVRLWDVSTGRCTRLFAGHTSGVTALAFSPDGQSISTADDSGVIHSWDLDSSRCFKTMLGHDNAVYALDYSGGGGEILASAGADDTVRIWDHKDGLESVVTGIVPKIAPTKTFRTKNCPVVNVEFTRRNLLLAYGCRRLPVYHQT